MLKKILITIFFVSLLYVAGCSEDSTEPIVTNPEGTLNLTLNGLEDLGSTAINSSGQLSKSGFQINSATLNSATAFILTIEPVPDPSTSPSSQKILAGDFSGNTASLLINHAAALGNDFSTATGSYVLATPTDADTTNELSGIWFLKLPPPPQAGLMLPTLPAGWVYEGWVVVPGSSSPVSTGRFTSASGTDEAAPFSGSLPGPPFPGEDLLQNAPSGLTFPTNLSTGVAVISVEPNPDNSSAPFALKPLVGNIPSNAADHFNYDMTNQSASNNPTGTVTR